MIVDIMCQGGGCRRHHLSLGTGIGEIVVVVVVVVSTHGRVVVMVSPSVLLLLLLLLLALSPSSSSCQCMAGRWWWCHCCAAIVTLCLPPSPPHHRRWSCHPSIGHGRHVVIIVLMQGLLAVNTSCDGRRVTVHRLKWNGGGGSVDIDVIGGRVVVMVVMCVGGLTGGGA